MSLVQSNDHLSWQNNYSQSLIEFYQEKAGPKAEKTISWIKKNQHFLAKDVFDISFTKSDIEAFKVSPLGQKFAADCELLKGLLSPNIAMPQILSSFLNQKPIWKGAKGELKDSIARHEKMIKSMFKNIAKNKGSCLGQTLSLSKHLITHGGTIAKLEIKKLDKMELIFFQASQCIYSYPLLAKSYLERVWSEILQERQKRSRWQKFLHRNEPKLENVRWDFSPLIEKSNELHKSLFFQFPKLLVNDELLPKNWECYIDNKRLKSFFMKSKRALGAVAYAITVIDHAILLHCNENSKTFELYECGAIGLLSFSSKEKAVEVTLELIKTLNSRVEKVQMLYVLEPEVDSEIFVV